MPKLSIITVNLNDYKGLEKTLKSVWENQSFSDFEHIVIDGASTDGSVDVIKRYANKLAYWVSEPDSGIYNAMNKGILKAKGDYLLFLNGGDWLADDVLCKVFSNDYNEDFIYGNFTYVYRDNKTRYREFEDEINFTTVFNDSLGHQSTFIKRSLFDKELYREDYKIISDWIFFVKYIIQDEASTRHVDLNIAFFNDYGVSTKPTAYKKILEEKRRFLKSIHGNLGGLLYDVSDDYLKCKDYIQYITDFRFDLFTTSPWLLHNTRKCVRALFKLKKALGVRH